MFSGKKEMLRTQGRLFDFHEGDVVHDTKHAYKEWGEALQHLKLSISKKTRNLKVILLKGKQFEL